MQRSIACGINLDKPKEQFFLLANIVYFFQGSNLVRTVQEMNKKTQRKPMQQKMKKVKKQRQKNNLRMKKG